MSDRHYSSISGMEAIPQIAWYKQVRRGIEKECKTIDRLTVKEIIDLYKDNITLCDDCGAEMKINDRPIIDHILHLINTHVIWSCDKCIDKIKPNPLCIEVPDDKQGMDYT